MIKVQHTLEHRCGMVYASGLDNEEFADAMRQCLDKAKEIFGAVPLQIQAWTWDMDYGDVLPDGLIMIRPKLTAYKAAERIEQHRAAK